ncbi:hypothetical protein [Actinoallomurus sp. NPDC052274]|uniref:hypothetical protein n=1 Tax=Actinoallomurus sp. NPDC052274 TaxID=3155420 RepID=UPI0034337B9E
MHRRQRPAGAAQGGGQEVEVRHGRAEVARRDELGVRQVAVAQVQDHVRVGGEAAEEAGDLTGEQPRGEGPAAGQPFRHVHADQDGRRLQLPDDVLVRHRVERGHLVDDRLGEHREVPQGQPRPALEHEDRQVERVGQAELQADVGEFGAFGPQRAELFQHLA